MSNEWREITEILTEMDASTTKRMDVLSPK